jgi:predicted MFS family arabinose efflux permease
MWLWSDNFRAIFWVAVIPATISVVLLIFCLKEPAKAVEKKRTNPLSRDNLRLLSKNYWAVVGFAALFTLARFSDAFLLLRAQDGGMTLALIPLVLVVMNFAYSMTSYPAGVLSDRVGQGGLLVVGMMMLIGADILLAVSNHWALVLSASVLWGIHMGMTQGILAAMVAHMAPEKLRGTAFGMFNLASGISMLVASVLAGLLWDRYSPSATFIAGALFSVIALVVFQWVREKPAAKTAVTE